MRSQATNRKRNLTETLARGTAINLTGFIVRAILLFAHSFFGTWLYGIEMYGVYATGVAIVTLASTVGRLGFERTVTRFVAIYATRNEPEKFNSILFLTLVLTIPVSLLLGLLLSFCAEPIAAVFGDLVLTPSLKILGITVPILTLGTLLAAFTQGFKQMHYKVMVLDVCAPLIEVVGMLILAWFGSKQLGLPIAYAISIAVSSLLLVAITKRQLPNATMGWSSLQHNVLKELLTPMFSFTLPVLAMNILLNVSQQISTLLLGVFGTSAMVGVFNILLRIIATCTRFLFSMNLMISPMIADLVERKRIDELSHLYKTSVRWLLITSLPLFLFIFFFGTELLQLWGKEVAVNANALFYLILAMVVNVSTGSCGVILTMSGHPKDGAINEGLGLAITTIFCILLIPSYGVVGAALAYSVGVIVANLARLFQVWWHLRIHPYSWSLLHVLLAGGAMSVILGVVKIFWEPTSQSWGHIGVASGLAVVIYSIITLTTCLEQNETEIARKYYQRIAAPMIALRANRKQST
jgi:O-antigen/teichoic acid export membrane protein